MAAMSGNEEAKKEAINQYVTASLEPLLRQLEQRLSDNGTGFLIGNKVRIYSAVDSCTQFLIKLKLFSTLCALYVVGEFGWHWRFLLRRRSSVSPIERMPVLRDFETFYTFDIVRRSFGVTEPFAKSSQVTNLINRIGAIPSIKEWMNKRPVTPF